MKYSRYGRIGMRYCLASNILSWQDLGFYLTLGYNSMLGLCFERSVNGTLRYSLQIMIEPSFTILLETTWIICPSHPHNRLSQFAWIFLLCFVFCALPESMVPLRCRKCLHLACSDMVGALWSMPGWLHWSLFAWRLKSSLETTAWESLHASLDKWESLHASSDKSEHFCQYGVAILRKTVNSKISWRFSQDRVPKMNTPGVQAWPRKQVLVGRGADGCRVWSGRQIWITYGVIVGIWLPSKPNVEQGDFWWNRICPLNYVIHT